LDIKLKSSYFYKFSLIFAIFLLSLSLISIVDVIRNSKYFDNEYYFKSYSFKHELSDFFSKIEHFYTEYKDYAKKSDDIKVTDEDIRVRYEVYASQLQIVESNITFDYSLRINEAEKAEDKKLMDALIHERDQKIEKRRIEYQGKIASLKAEFLIIKNKNFNDLKRSIESRKDIGYLIKTNDTNEVYSNLFNDLSVENYINGKANYTIENYINNNALYSIKFPLVSNNDPYLNQINNYFKTEGATGYLVIPKGIKTNSQIYIEYQDYQKQKERIITVTIFGILSIAIIIALLTFLWKKKKSELQFIAKIIALLRRVPLDILVAILLTIPFILTPYYFSFSYFTEEISVDHFLLLALIVSYLCFAILSVTWIINLIKTKKTFIALREECLLYKFACLVKDCLLFKNTFFQTIVIIIFTISYGLLWASLFQPNLMVVRMLFLFIFLLHSFIYV
jgi:hypothetical protein